MPEHLNNEIPTLESSKMRATFSESEVKAIESGFVRAALKLLDPYTTLPFTMVCGNPATPGLPAFPLPLKWATRWWFARRHHEAWEFGPVDLYGTPRKTPTLVE